MSDKEIKVTDKRMFTADGELREEFAEAEGSQEPEGGASDKEPSEEPQPQTTPPPGPAPGAEAPESAGVRGEPTFLDLVGVVAEPIALYLGDSALPDGRSLENLDVARLYIDLLEVLREKTEGNLDPDEQRVLDELLYQLRMRYVQKRG